MPPIALRGFCLLLTALCLASTGCAHMTDRARDAGDVVAVSGGLGLGTQVKVGPLYAGWVPILVDFVGWRYGWVPWPNSRDMPSMTFNPLLFYLETSTSGEDRGKPYAVGGVHPGMAEGGGNPDVPIPELEGPLYLGIVSVLLFETPRSMLEYVEDPEMPGRLIRERAGPRSVNYQIELYLALGLSLRVGVNPAEIVDFFSGWFGYDLFDDDIELEKAREKDEPPPGDEKNAENLATEVTEDSEE